MIKDAIKRIITNEILKATIKKYGLYFLPAAVSNRHIHLSKEDKEKLFGRGYQLRPIKELSQPGQYACEERVTIIGKKGTIENVRVLGPERKETQLEVSVSDCYTLGIKPVIRMSGDLDNTPGITIEGPKGRVELQKGVVVAARHLHISEEEAKLYGLKDGDVIRVKKSGIRETIFGNVLVRSGFGHRLELHFDIEEANAAGIKNGDLLLIEK